MFLATQQRDSVRAVCVHSSATVLMTAALAVSHGLSPLLNAHFSTVRSVRQQFFALHGVLLSRLHRFILCSASTAACIARISCIHASHASAHTLTQRFACENMPLSHANLGTRGRQRLVTRSSVPPLQRPSDPDVGLPNFFLACPTFCPTFCPILVSSAL